MVAMQALGLEHCLHHLPEAYLSCCNQNRTELHESAGEY